MSKMEIGVIGAGAISSQAHIPLLSCMENVSVKYIADIKDPYRLAKAYKTESIKINDVSSLPDCDTVLLAIPVGAREEYIHELSKRKIPISETFAVIIAFAVYQVGFVLLGAWQPESLNILI